MLESVRLGQNGWANQYYSAAARSMLGSLHNFFFVSSDPGGLITVDKPPLGLWLQTVSAAIFGFHPLSLLVPEVVCGVLGVVVVYFVVAPRAGVWAGVAAAATLAVFPSFVASARDNNLDALLILLMALSCLTGLRAIEQGSWRWLAATAVLVGLAFNTKTLAAFLVLPGLAVGWLVCAPVPPRRRVGMLAGATAVLAVVSLVWVVAVQLVPAGDRPYVGGTSNNSELTLSFGHNGLGRVLGERNAPGHIVHAAGVGRRVVELSAARVATRAHRQTGSISSVGAVSPGRLFDNALGDQGAWMLPLALAGLVALIAAVWRRRDDRRIGLLLVGGGVVRVRGRRAERRDRNRPPVLRLRARARGRDHGRGGRRRVRRAGATALELLSCRSSGSSSPSSSRGSSRTGSSTTCRGCGSRRRS